VFRNRYNLIHQRLLRNESFQARSFEAAQIPSFRRSSSSLATSQSYKLTPIANLLGRNGSNHLLLGLLTIAPTGTLAINDLTGSIALDLTHAKTVPEDGAWFVPGMIVLVDGVYEEEDDVSGGGLGGIGGVGGTIGGKFVGFTVGGPPCERRQVTLGVSGSNENGDVTAGGGFGWVDFLGVGSERAVGSRMQKIEQRLIGRPSRRNDRGGRGRMVIMGEVNLDQPRTLQALKKLFGLYAAEPEEDTPMTFILMGNFVQHAVMARGGSGGSIEYKEYFDALASILSEFPTLLQTATFIFVPGDNDGWASSFSSGAAAPIPRKAIPDMFTSRIKRAFANASAEAEKEQGSKTDGEALWTTNPSRLSLFGPAHEIVLFRDDISSRFRRTAIRFSPPKPADPDANAEMTTPAPESSTNTHAPENPTTQLGDEMEIDSAVRDAESHIPKDASASETLSLSSDLHAARKLVKTVLDQGYLAPFRMANRPVLWDYAGALQLYPLPTALVLADAEAPAFCVTYEGCHVMNPGGVVAPGRRGVVKWVEYHVRNRVGTVREALF
jgi:DNA polymerase epsilon subunit 2